MVIWQPFCDQKEERRERGTEGGTGKERENKIIGKLTKNPYTLSH